ncbi:MAG: nicotinate phosphoribosyltransferase [Bacteroidales bacterium]
MIIKSMLDTDLYTLTVMYFYMMKLPRAVGQYTFCDRNNMVFPPNFAYTLMEECKKMESLSFSDSDIEFLEQHMYYMPPFFFDYLKGVKFDSSMVSIYQDSEGHLSVTVKGKLYLAVLWEVPLLAMISELYYKMTGIDENFNTNETLDIVKENTQNKALSLFNEGVKFSEFGTRRRASFDVQDAVIGSIVAAGDMTNNNTLSGTSNLFFAKKYGIKPIGTMSHQLVSAVGALFGYAEANYLAMQWWQEIFNADLGIYLADTYTTDVFVRNFSKLHAKLWDGVRQDSGDPIEFTKKIVSRYNQLGIDPTTKSITYSDALTVKKAINIHNTVKPYIKPQFGIGTHFTNDIDGVKPCNIVIKLTDVSLTEKTEMKHCIKLSDSKGKYMGDADTIKNALFALNIN